MDIQWLIDVHERPADIWRDNRRGVDMRGGERENFGQDVKTKKLENNKINT